NNMKSIFKVGDSIFDDLVPTEIKNYRKGWWSKHRGRQVIIAAILSRILVFLISQASNLAVDDYDSSFDTLFINEDALTPLEVFVKNVVKVYARWDSFYYLHIAQHGYVYEQDNAFFPMFPLLINFFAFTALFPLRAFMNEQLVMMVSGIIISNLSFVGSCVALYRLGIVLFTNENFAFLSAMLYCITPSNIFMSAIYTESTFALFSFICMRLIAEKKYYLAAFYLGLGSFTRSNCVCYVGFFIWDFFLTNYNWVYSRRVFIQRLFHVMVLALISVSGFLIFQIQGYNQFCKNIPPRDGESPWSFPMITYCISGISIYAKYDIKRFLSLSMLSSIGNIGSSGSKCSGTKKITTEETSKNKKQTKILKRNAGDDVISSIKPKSSAFLGWAIDSRFCFLSSNLLPYIYLWSFLLIVSVTTMHVQIITRFMSSLPVIYWYLAHLIFSSDSEPGGDKTTSKKIPPEASRILNIILYYSAI
ncbi:hypothetical protein BB560_005461, partial [Smittium megazygosporum]